MNPTELSAHLAKLLESGIPHSVMIWGPPGVGKSSIVATATRQAGIGLVDVRLSQLAPTDLRGLPAVSATSDTERGRTEWCPPDFLPHGGKGVLFLDEFNMAPPAMQGIAQQLILDRHVGSYRLPDGWVVWAAGNRRQDKASVFDMPAPLANRFLHIELESNFDCFKQYALANHFPESIIAFLAARPGLLHKADSNSHAWPSPRSWEMAARLDAAGLPGDAAVGESTWHEYGTFLLVRDRMPSIEAILESDSCREKVEDSLDMRFAVCTALAMRARTAGHAVRAFRWVHKTLDREWTAMLVQDLSRSMQAKNLQGAFVQAMQSDPAFRAFMKERADLMVTS